MSADTIGGGVVVVADGVMVGCDVPFGVGSAVVGSHVVVLLLYVSLRVGCCRWCRCC